ncbi:MAG: DNA replication/repair protein RecF [Gammaproteobacteria bacterium]|nr:DNA replication/repair protein RecF [Gammaproteobacteria bacterium]
MALSTLKITNFRCIEAAALSLSEDENYFFGDNGAGKTSILEAAYFLGRGRSFRTHRPGRLVRDGMAGFSVVGHVSWSGHDVVLGVEGSRGGVQARIGGAPAESLSGLAERLAVQVIDPEVHRLVEEGPGRRRRFLDWGVFHVKPGFLGAWRRYQRALKQRNAALRQGLAAERVTAWDPELIVAAQQITGLREDYVAALTQGAALAAADLLGATVSLEYERGWAGDGNLTDALADSLARDRRHGRTHAGPHRADLKIRFEDKPARDRVSRGQQKLLAAALVLAQLDLLRDATGHRGVLLLDDPAAELDAESLKRLMNRVAGMGVQRLITGLDERGLAPTASAARFTVSAGRVSKLV